MKAPIPNLNEWSRTRLRLTVVSMIFIGIVAVFCAYVLWTDNLNQGAWTCMGGALVAWTTAVGLYVNHETRRPSFQNNTIVNMPTEIPDDKSDPEDIPL